MKIVKDNMTKSQDTLERLETSKHPNGIDLLECMRPLHWVKNIFVFVPLMFSYQLFNLQSVIRSVIVFGIFCIASSAVYVLNDIFDRGEDLHHPSKRLRPITRGMVSVKDGVTLSAMLILISLVGSAIMSLSLFAVIAAYIVLNLSYSVWLKKILILDVLIIAIGFVMRVLAGAQVLTFEVSNWILISTFFLSALIGFSKRRYESLMDGSPAVLNRGYTPYILDLLMLAMAAAVLTSYGYYVMFRGNWQNGIAIQLSVLVVFFGVFRYVLLIHRSEENLDHTKLILTDKPLVSAVIIWIGLSLVELYIINPHLILDSYVH